MLLAVYLNRKRVVQKKSSFKNKRTFHVNVKLFYSIFCVCVCLCEYSSPLGRNVARRGRYKVMPLLSSLTLRLKFPSIERTIKKCKKKK